jgi:hypothetical protein
VALQASSGHVLGTFKLRREERLVVEVSANCRSGGAEGRVAEETVIAVAIRSTVVMSTATMTPYFLTVCIIALVEKR